MLVSRLRSGALVAARQLGRRYGEQWALRDVTVTINPGSVVAFAGASGAGKSTLLHLLAAYDRADRGEVIVDGSAVTRLRGRALDRYRRRVGFVLPQSQFLPGLSVLDNVLAATLAARRVDFDRQARARGLLAATGIAGCASEPAGRLSPGEQQRVAIARALIWQPALLLADEPTASLDSTAARTIVDLLLALQRQFGMTLVIATHHHQVAALCDRVVTLGDGRVIDDQTLYGEHESTATSALAAGGTVTPMSRTAELRRVHRTGRPS